MTKDESRTRAATAARVAKTARRRHEKWAQEMREWGWTCEQPGTPTI